MKLQWLGHSCFRLVESTGATVITDPYDNRIGHTLPEGITADIVTVSHGHSDHNNHKAVGGHPIVLTDAGSYDIKGISISTVSSHHDGNGGAERGHNLIFKFRMDGVVIAHLGDLGEECTPELIEQLLPVNILLIPVGGNYTLDAGQAHEYIDALMPDVVIPMHYKTRQSELDIDKVDVFLRRFDSEHIIYADSDTELSFDREYFDDTTHIIVPKLTDKL